MNNWIIIVIISFVSLGITKGDPIELRLPEVLQIPVSEQLEIPETAVQPILEEERYQEISDDADFSSLLEELDLNECALVQSAFYRIFYTLDTGKTFKEIDVPDSLQKRIIEQVCLFNDTIMFSCNYTKNNDSIKTREDYFIFSNGNIIKVLDSTLLYNAKISTQAKFPQNKLLSTLKSKQLGNKIIIGTDVGLYIKDTINSINLVDYIDSNYYTVPNYKKRGFPIIDLPVISLAIKNSMIVVLTKEIIYKNIKEDSLSKIEKAFIIMTGIEKQTFYEVKKICNIDGNDNISDICHKINKYVDKPENKDNQGIRDFQLIVNMADSIRNYLDYQKYKNNQVFKSKYSNRNIQDIFFKYDKLKNDIINDAFAITLEQFKNIPSYSSFYQILKKYEIPLPLLVGRKILDKMELYEEDIFNTSCSNIKYFALLNLSTVGVGKIINSNRNMQKEIDSYMYLSEKNKGTNFSKYLLRDIRMDSILHNIDKDEKINDYMGTNYISYFTKKSIMKLQFSNTSYYFRHYIKKNPSVVSLLLNNPYIDQNSAVFKFAQKQDSSRNKDIEMFDSFETIVNEIQNKIELGSEERRIRKEIYTLIENEFYDIYIKPCSYINIEKRKIGLQNTLQSLQLFESMNDFANFYYCLTDSTITLEEKVNFIQLRRMKDNNEIFWKDSVNPLDYRLGVDNWIMSYTHPLAQQLLTKYSELSKETNNIYANSNISPYGIYKSLYQKFVHLLILSGFKEKDVLMIDAIHTFNLLPKTQKNQLNKLTSSSEHITYLEDQLLVLQKLLKNNSNSKEQNDKFNENITVINNFTMVFAKSHLDGLIHSYNDRLEYSNNVGNTLLAELQYSMITFEKNDDEYVKNIILDLLTNNNSSALKILAKYLANLKACQLPIDTNFVIQLVKYSGYNLDLQTRKYNSSNIYSLLYECAINKEFEANLMQKPYFDASLNKLKDYFKNFVKENSEIFRENFGSQETYSFMGIYGSIISLISDLNILDESEAENFFKNITFIESTPKFGIQDIQTNKSFCTIGYKNIPKEIKDILNKSSLRDTIEEYLNDIDNMTIYWVPKDASTVYLGYSPLDKHIIFVTYNAKQDSLCNLYSMTNTLVHEFNHKFDNLKLNRFKIENRDSLKAFSNLPSLFTERNSYIVSYQFYNDILNNPDKFQIPSKDSVLKNISSEIVWNQGIVSLANILIGLDSNDYSIKNPPFNGINLYSSYLNLNPAVLYKNRITYTNISNFKKELQNNSKYKTDEVTRITENIILSQLQGANLNNLELNRRYLLVDYIGKSNRIKNYGNFETMLLVSLIKRTEKSISYFLQDSINSKLSRFSENLTDIYKRNKIKVTDKISLEMFNQLFEKDPFYSYCYRLVSKYSEKKDSLLSKIETIINTIKQNKIIDMKKIDTDEMQSIKKYFIDIQNRANDIGFKELYIYKL
ncbi:MAG: hypothetical protein WCR42_02050 [bacterium]